MTLGMEVGLRRLCVKWGPSPQKGAEPPPQFSAHFYCDQRARCMKMPLGTEVGLGPGHIVLGGSLEKWAQPPTFRLMTIVAKRSPILATAYQLLFSSADTTTNDINDIARRDKAESA